MSTQSTATNPGRTYPAEHGLRVLLGDLEDRQRPVGHHRHPPVVVQVLRVEFLAINRRHNRVTQRTAGNGVRYCTNQGWCQLQTLALVILNTVRYPSSPEKSISKI